MICPGHVPGRPPPAEFKLTKALMNTLPPPQLSHERFFRDFKLLHPWPYHCMACFISAYIHAGTGHHTLRAASLFSALTVSVLPNFMFKQTILWVNGLKTKFRLSRAQLYRLSIFLLGSISCSTE